MDERQAAMEAAIAVRDAFIDELWFNEESPFASYISGVGLLTEDWLEGFAISVSLEKRFPRRLKKQFPKTYQGHKVVVRYIGRHEFVR